MGTTIILLSFEAFLVKVLFMGKKQRPNKIIEWMKQDNDKSGVDVFEI